MYHLPVSQIAQNEVQGVLSFMKPQALIPVLEYICPDALTSSRSNSFISYWFHWSTQHSALNLVGSWQREWYLIKKKKKSSSRRESCLIYLCMA